MSKVITISELDKLTPMSVWYELLDALENDGIVTIFTKPKMKDVIKSLDRVTKSRLAILRELQKNDWVYDYSFIYEKLVGKKSKVTRATVYNFYIHLKEKGFNIPCK